MSCILGVRNVDEGGRNQVEIYGINTTNRALFVYSWMVRGKGAQQKFSSNPRSSVMIFLHIRKEMRMHHIYHLTSFVFAISLTLNLAQPRYAATSVKKHASLATAGHHARNGKKHTSTLTANRSRARSGFSSFKAKWQSYRKQTSSITRKEPFPGRASKTASFRRAYQPRSIGAIMVNTTADDGAYDYTSSDTTASGAISLRSAIQFTNYIPGSDTIILPAGVYTLTNTGADEYDAATGDLNINDSVTIIGAGAGSTIIDGNGADRVFGIDYYSSGIKVTISDPTIENGTAPSGENGGGIEIYDGTVVLNSVDIDGNIAPVQVVE